MKKAILLLLLMSSSLYGFEYVVDKSSPPILDSYSVPITVLDKIKNNCKYPDTFVFVSATRIRHVDTESADKSDLYSERLVDAMGDYSNSGWTTKISFTFRDSYDRTVKKEVTCRVVDKSGKILIY